MNIFNTATNAPNLKKKPAAGRENLCYSLKQSEATGRKSHPGDDNRTTSFQ